MTDKKLTDKEKPCPFNDLPFEERKRINYYINEARILLLKQVLYKLNNSIGEYQKKKLRAWIKNIEEFHRNEYTEKEI